MKKIVGLFVMIGMVAATAAGPSETDNLLTAALHFVKDCGDRSMFLCMKVSERRIFLSIFKYYRQSVYEVNLLE